MVALLLAGGLPSVVASGFPEFAGVTTIRVEGAGVGRFSLPVADTLVGLSIETPSQHGAVFVAGPGVWVWLFRNGANQMGFGQPGVGGEQSLGPGTYYVYLLADPPTSATVEMRFRDRPGTASFEVGESVPARFGPLASSIVPATGGTGYQRWAGTQPFEGRAFTGFLIHERQLGPTAQPRELRWSSQEGIMRCDAWNLVIVSGLSETRIAAAEPGDLRDVTLAYYHVGLGAVLEQHVDGLWVQRTLDDPHPEPMRVVTPPLWSTYQGNDLLDHDAECAQAQAGLLVASVTDVLPEP